MTYSPSQTEMFARCPALWWLKRKQGYTTRYIPKNQLAQWMGNAIHEGVASYYINNRKPSARDLEKTILTEWDSLVTEALDNGRVIEGKEVEIRLEIEGKLTRAGELIITQDPFPLSWEIIHIEGILGEDNSRIDLGGRDNNGIPWYADFKTTMYCLVKDIPSRVSDYAWSSQMMHYAYHYSQALGEPVRRYFIPFVVMGPKPLIQMEQFEMEPELMDRWYTSAKQWWWQMDTWNDMAIQHGEQWVTDHILMSPNHKDGWGKCEMYDACTLYKMEPSLMATQYLQIQKSSVI